MFFQSIAFVLFFAFISTIYWTLRNHRARMIWLLAVSCVYYMTFHPFLIALILFSACIDFLVALRLSRLQNPWIRRALLAFSIAVNLGLLAFFKYTDFFLLSTHGVAGWIGIDYPLRTLDLLLPLGISFYTFETISYIVDVYRGKQTAVRDPLDYALYIMFFPHLLAGPIVRPREFLPQVGRRKRFNWDRLHVGVQFFLRGLFKKVILADHLASIVDPVFASPGQYATSALWLGAVAYAVQIYCDFSGYSDMAVGLAHALGFKLPRNFNLPYLAVNVAEFWQRWHISLSSWLRDYLFIPLGGSRGGRWKTYRNILLTMTLSGLWHGASWNCVLWGFYHGVLLSLHRACPFPFGGRVGRELARASTFLACLIGLVIFRSGTLVHMQSCLTRMVWPVEGLKVDRLHSLIGLACIGVVALGHGFGEWIKWKRLERLLPAPVLGAGLAMMLMLVQVLMVNKSQIFIYFRF